MSNIRKFEHDDIERNLYLKSFLTGERQGPPTGKPSIDKPWLINYSDEEIASYIPSRRMYEDILEGNKENLDSIAIEYFNKKITYRELFNNIDKTASAFIQSGVKKGDIVSVSMPYLPETVYTIYALNKIGAVINMIDPRINKQLISDYINNANSKYIIIIDKVEKKIEAIIKDTCIEKVISVPATNSMNNKLLRKIGNLKRSKFTKWNNFIKVPYIETKIAKHEKDDLAVIEYTSGTSGNPKGVMLSDDAFNAMSYFQNQSLKSNVGDKFLLIMPPFIAYGLVIGMHGMLSQGQHLLMIPNFTLDKAPKMLGELIDKHHPNRIMGVPNFLLILMNYKKDLSFLKEIIVGGDHLDGEIERKGRIFLESHGSRAVISKGWGMTEIASCGTFTKSDTQNNIGSVGIPLSKNNVKLLSKKNNLQENKKENYNIDDEELYFGEEGTLFISSPTMALGYYKNLKATDEIVYLDKEGRKWLNTGDIFKISEDGSLYFCGREKRIVVRPDGHNIPSGQIESIASSLEEVKTAIVVGTKSKKYAHGSLAAVCIETKNNDLSVLEQEELLNKINLNCKKALQPRDRAKYFILINNMPYTPNGKIDYIGLTKYVEEKINNIFEDEESREEFFIIDELKDVKRKVRKRK